MITVFGTIALDTTETPFRKMEKILGGAATYSALSSSFFYPTSIAGIVGQDFPKKYRDVLNSRLDTKGLITDNKNKTFHYDSSFDYDLYHRKTNKTELNVIENYEPTIPSEYLSSEYLYLANNDPHQNLKVIDLFKKTKLVLCDTIDFWITNKSDQVFKMMQKSDGVVINDDEARLLTNNSNLIKCARKIIDNGTKFVVIKKGENGSILFTKNHVFPSPAFPIEDVMDPTGAGDAFAGGFLGHIARCKKINIRILREAMIYGNVMGSFVVEDFGIEKLLRIKYKDIQKRYKIYRSIVHLQGD